MENIFRYKYLAFHKKARLQDAFSWHDVAYLKLVL